MGAPRVTKEAIQRAINATKEAGICIGAVVVNNTDGTVRIEALDTETVYEKPETVQPSTPKKWK